LPFLNAELGGFEYIKDPPSVTFRLHGKLLTVHGNKIAVNALKDETEARKIVEWLKREINNAWKNHDNITPRYEGLPRPQVIQILKCLPMTNCRECGESTCMVFATRVAECRDFDRLTLSEDCWQHFLDIRGQPKRLKWSLRCRKRGFPF